MESIKKYIAEFIGTGVLVFFGCGVAAVTGCLFPDAGYVATALAFGLIIVAMAYSIGNVSGCHINPAVSLGVLLTGGMSVKDFCGYVAAQFIGAIAGAWALLLVLGDSYGLGANHIYGAPDAPSLKISLVIEAVLTFVFVLSVLGATSKKENSHLAGIVIGLSLALVHLLGIPFTGTSVNPARSFGPALLLGGESLKCVWVFIVAPLVGGAAAALVWRFLNPAKKD